MSFSRCIGPTESYFMTYVSQMCSDSSFSTVVFTADLEAMIGALFCGIIWIAATSVFTYWLIETYAKPETAFSVRLTVFVCWMIGFFIPYLLPLDFYGGYTDVLEVFWSVVYFFILFLCWVLVPLLQTYYDNGGFTKKDKIKEAFIDELKFYLAVVVIAGSLIAIMLIYGTFTLDEVPGLIIVLANTWGLSLLTIMLGYGIVAVPRLFWHSADRELQADQLYYRLSSLHDDAVAEQDRMQQTHAFVQQLDNDIPTGHPLRHELDIIREKTLAPTEYRFADITPSTPIEQHSALNKLREKRDGRGLTYHDMMSLHYVVIRHIRAHKLTKADWMDAVNDLLWLQKLQEITQTYRTPESLPDSQIPAPSPTTYPPFPGAWIWPFLYRNEVSSGMAMQDTISALHDVEEGQEREISRNPVSSRSDEDNSRKWWFFPSPIDIYNYPMQTGTWHHKLTCMWFRFLIYRHRMTMRGTALILGILSLLLLWSELSILFPLNLSPFSWLIGVGQGSVFLTLIFAMIPLLYLTACTFYTLFRIRLFSLYHMHKRQRTGENSILHNAAFMLRLILPLAYNFFRIARDTDTAFSHVHGAMQAVPFLGGEFNTYMPAFILVIAAITFFDCFGIIFRWLGIPKFQYSSHSRANSDAVEGGKKLFIREQRFRRSGKYEDGRKTTESGPIFKPTGKYTRPMPQNAAITVPSRDEREKAERIKNQNRYHSQRENTIRFDDF